MLLSATPLHWWNVLDVAALLLVLVLIAVLPGGHK